MSTLSTCDLDFKTKLRVKCTPLKSSIIVNIGNVWDILIDLICLESTKFYARFFPIFLHFPCYPYFKHLTSSSETPPWIPTDPVALNFITNTKQLRSRTLKYNLSNLIFTMSSTYTFCLINILYCNDVKYNIIAILHSYRYSLASFRWFQKYCKDFYFIFLRDSAW